MVDACAEQFGKIEQLIFQFQSIAWPHGVQRVLLCLGKASLAQNKAFDTTFFGWDVRRYFRGRLGLGGFGCFFGHGV